MTSQESCKYQHWSVQPIAPPIIFNDVRRRVYFALRTLPEKDLARGAFTYAPPTLAQLTRAMEVDRRFADLSLGLVDASLVALAESLGIRRWRHATCVASPLFDSVMVVRSISSFIPATRTSPEVHRPRVARVDRERTSACETSLRRSTVSTKPAQRAKSDSRHPVANHGVD